MSIWRTLRIIARLKWLLTIRHYRKHWGTALATGLALFMLGGAAVFGGAFLAAACHFEGPSFRDPALLWSAWILSLLWIGSPLLQFDVQRNLDLNGLRLLPISRAGFTLAVLLDAALSPLGLLYVPLLAVAIAAFSLSWLDGVLVVLALALLAICWLGLGQALYLWANRLLQSRRFADLSIVIGLVLFLGIQALNMALHSADELELPAWLLGGWRALGAIFGPLLGGLFPSLAARAVAAGSAGLWGEALMMYAALIGQAAICAYLASIAARQFYEGELESGGRAPGARAGRRGAGRAARRARALLGGPLGAIFHRERLYLARDPLFKILLIQSLFFALYFVFAVVLIRVQSAREGSELLASFGHYALLLIALALSFSESAVLFNKFGYEGGLLCHTLISPIDRRRLLAAKSIFYLSHFGGINMVLIAGLALLMRVPAEYGLAAVLMVAFNTAIVDLVGHFVSIYFPFTYRRRGRGVRAVMPQPGCGYMFLYTLVFQACNLAVLPGSAALGLGVIFGGWGGLVLGIVVAGAVTGAAYYFGLPLAARLLSQREPELIATLSRSAE